jgi:hypothetical protein
MIRIRIRNRDAAGYVRHAQPFQGSNLYGEYFRCPGNQEGQYGFVVYSYGPHFPIYIGIHMANQTRWFANKDRYSAATPRHQSQARPVPHDQLQWLTTEGMLRVVRGGYQALVSARVIDGEVVS